MKKKSNYSKIKTNLFLETFYINVENMKQKQITEIEILSGFRQTASSVKKIHNARNFLFCRNPISN